MIVNKLSKCPRDLNSALITEFEIKVFGFYLDVTPDEFGKPVFEEKTAITIGIPNTDLYVWLPRQGAYVPTDGSWKENGQINTYTTAAVGVSKYIAWTKLT